MFAHRIENSVRHRDGTKDVDSHQSPPFGGFRVCEWPKTIRSCIINEDSHWAQRFLDLESTIIDQRRGTFLTASLTCSSFVMSTGNTMVLTPNFLHSAAVSSSSAFVRDNSATSAPRLSKRDSCSLSDASASSYSSITLSMEYL